MVIHIFMYILWSSYRSIKCPKLLPIAEDRIHSQLFIYVTTTSQPISQQQSPRVSYISVPRRKDKRNAPRQPQSNRITFNCWSNTPLYPRYPIDPIIKRKMKEIYRFILYFRVHFHCDIRKQKYNIGNKRPLKNGCYSFSFQFFLFYSSFFI